MGVKTIVDGRGIVQRNTTDASTFEVRIGGGGGLVFATIAALKAFDDGSLSDGALAVVKSVQDIFVLDKSNGTTGANDISIVESATGYRWIRRATSQNPRWASQSAWFIDPTNGNDENVGSASDAAIKTAAELGRRINRSTIPQTTTVTLLGDLTSADPLVIDAIMASGCYLAIEGTPATVLSGTLSATTALDRDTNSPATITGTGLGSHVGKRVRFTASGKKAWIAKDLGADQVRISPPCNAVNYGGIPGPGAPVVTTLTGNEAFVVETLTAVPAANIRVATGNHGALGNVLYVKNINAGGTDGDGWGWVINGESDVGYVWVESHAAASAMRDNGGWELYSNSRASHGFTFSGKTMIFAGATINTQPGDYTETVRTNGYVHLDRDHLIQSAGLLARRDQVVSFGACGIFDAPGNAFGMGESASGNAHSFIRFGYSATLLYGSGNLGAGIALGAGQRFLYSVKPIITGSTGAVLIGSASATPYSSIPFVNTTNYAMIVSMSLAL